MSIKMMKLNKGEVGYVVIPANSRAFLEDTKSLTTDGKKLLLVRIS
jgi:hypothetical protein